MFIRNLGKRDLNIFSNTHVTDHAKNLANERSKRTIVDYAMQNMKENKSLIIERENPKAI